MTDGFTFPTVPLAEVKQKHTVLQTAPPRPVVLVVDDERVIADTLAAILKHAGFAALAAYDGQGALDIAKVIPPDLLLTDVVMPGMSGVELAITVRSLVPECGILLFSGQAATVDLLAEANRLGHHFNILSKPVFPKELLAGISQTLDLRATNTSLETTPGN